MRSFFSVNLCGYCSGIPALGRRHPFFGLNNLSQSIQVRALSSAFRNGEFLTTSPTSTNRLTDIAVSRFYTALRYTIVRGVTFSVAVSSLQQIEYTQISVLLRPKFTKSATRNCERRVYTHGSTFVMPITSKQKEQAQVLELQTLHLQSVFL